MPAPIGLPSQPRVEPPVPFVQSLWTKRPETKQQGGQGGQEARHSQANKFGVGTQQTWQAQTNPVNDRSASESEDQKTPTATKRVHRKKKTITVSVSSGSEAEEPKTPKAWYCTMDECHVGTFAMIESIYDDAGERGVSLVKVTSLEAPMVQISWPLNGSPRRTIKISNALSKKNFLFSRRSVSLRANVTVCIRTAWSVRPSPKRGEPVYYPEPILLKTVIIFFEMSQKKQFKLPIHVQEKLTAFSFCLFRKKT